jgi:hypothetical protein
MHAETAPAEGSWTISRSDLQHALAATLDFTAPLSEQCDSFGDLADALITELPVTVPSNADLKHAAAVKRYEAKRQLADPGALTAMLITIFIVSILVAALVIGRGHL